MCFAPQRRAIFRHLTFKKWSEPASFLTFWLTNVLLTTAACHFCWSQLPKWLRPWGVWDISTYKCASHHSGVPFLQIATSKMAPTVRCLGHFDVQMCFAPQRRAIFADRNFQNGSDSEVFCTFWLENVLRATAACHFSYLFSAAPSAPAAWTSLLFEHQEARIIEKTQRFATFLTFRAHVSADLTAVLLCFSVTWILFDSAFQHCSTLLFYSAFQLSILSEVRPLNFLRWYDFRCDYVTQWHVSISTTSHNNKFLPTKHQLFPAYHGAFGRSTPTSSLGVEKWKLQRWKVKVNMDAYQKWRDCLTVRGEPTPTLQMEMNRWHMWICFLQVTVCLLLNHDLLSKTQIWVSDCQRWLAVHTFHRQIQEIHRYSQDHEASLYPYRWF